MSLGLPERGDATRLVLVRHGQPGSGWAGRALGRTDVPLGPEGRAQAEAAAALLADASLDAVISSPLLRARETAAPIAAAHGLEPEIDEELREIDYGRLDGLTFPEIESRHPEVLRAWMETPELVEFPEGESLAALRARVLPAVARIRAAHPGETVAVVAHAGVLRVLLADALDLPDGAFFRLDQSYGAVSVVDHLEGTAVVRVANALPPL